MSGATPSTMRSIKSQCCRRQGTPHQQQNNTPAQQSQSRPPDRLLPSFDSSTPQQSSKMKFFAVAAIALPLINAAMLPARAAANTDLDLTPLTCPVSLEKLSGDLPVKEIDVLDVLTTLLNDGEIDLVDLKEAADLEKRAMVPGLHCGYTRAMSELSRWDQ
ncbi:unnamed protein product [Cercospora beticola]|nr:unnamed protein product [Cercospora beticola]